jgi:DNA-binding NtrC family response regulator
VASAESHATARALIVDDDAETRDALEARLSAAGFGVTLTSSCKAARKQLESNVFELVIADVDLPDGGGLGILDEIPDTSPTEIVLIGADSPVDMAVDAFRQGAIDFLPKPIDLGRIDKLAKQLIRTVGLSVQVGRLQAELRRLGHFGPLVAASKAMQTVCDLIEQVAPTDTTVLISGDPGVGKEVVATTIHTRSPRARGPFVPVNCGAIAAELVESELFGHERGAFTGADRERRGLFEAADGGTLFLDEITEMPENLQVRLLRVLETGRVRRVGGDTTATTDVRVIAATNRDPREAVEEGKLREDLLYRLLVFPIDVPPLRDRDDDIELLAKHFVAELREERGAELRLTGAALDVLKDYSWPGNVRELKHVLERAAIVADGEIRPEHLSLETTTDDVDEVVGAAGSAHAGHREGVVQVPIGSTIRDAERELILATLARNEGNKERSARILGISVKTLYNRLKVYDAEGSGRRNGTRGAP